MDDEFRYWSARATAETVAAINAACPTAAEAHRDLATLCMRRAVVAADAAMLAHGARRVQPCPA